MIVRLFNKIQGHAKGDSDEENIPTLKGPIQQLREIENNIMLMFEKRDYIEDKAENNKDLALTFQEAEKKAEKIRRDIRYDIRRKNEEQAEEARKLKIEKRMQRTKEASNSVNKSMKPAMARSEKPQIVKEKVQEKEMTQEELDYQRYVANMGSEQAHHLEKASQN